MKILNRKLGTKKPVEQHPTTKYPPAPNGASYYAVDGLMAVDADIKLSAGGRAAGKSTDAATTLMLWDAIANGNKFIFCRNEKSEVTQSKLQSYFNGARLDAKERPELNRFNRVEVTRYKRIKLLEVTDEGETVDSVEVGFAVSIEDALANKSMTLPTNTYDKLVMEEFANNYVKWPDYFERFTALVSTYGRFHDDFTVYGFANKVNRNNVFYQMYDLPPLDKQEYDTIDVYEMPSSPPLYDPKTGEQLKSRIAVENVKNEGVISTLLLGDGIQNNVTGDDYESKQQPIIDLEAKREECYRVYMHTGFLKFSMRCVVNRKGHVYWEVYPTKKIPKKCRLITNVVGTDPMHTLGLIPLSQGEKVLFEYIKNGKVFFLNNLTGTEFWRELENLK